MAGLLDTAASQGGALIVRGAAGTGKTVLAGYARGLAEDRDFQVLACTGVQSEALLGWAGTHQLLQGVIDHADALPPRQRDALRSTFGFGLGVETSPDRLLVAMAVLGLLGHLARRRPLLVVVEDVQWLDQETVNLLGFVARRLAERRIAVLVTGRSGGVDPLAASGLPELTLGRLPDADAAALLDEHVPGLHRELRTRILFEAEGNPLALVELSRGAVEHGLLDVGALPERLPLSARLERVFAAEVAELPAQSQDLLLVAALMTGSSLEELERAGAWLGIGTAALRAAESAALVRVSAGAVVFRHPLVRSAVYGAAAPARRRQAHRALGDVLADERGIWHRAAAVEGLDEPMAAALEDAADRATVRGEMGAASRLLERAAELSPDARDRALRLGRACDAAQLAGLNLTAVRLAEMTARLTDDPLVVARLAVTRCALAYTAVPGVPDPVELAAIAGGVAQLDEVAAADTLFHAAVAFNVAGADQPDAAAAVERELGALSLPTVALHAAAVRSLLDPAGHAGQCLPVLRSATEHLAALPPHVSVGLAIAAEPLHDWVLAGRYWSAAADGHRRQGGVTDLSSVLSCLGRTLVMRGRLVEGLAEAEQGHQLADDLDLPVMVGLSATVIAHVQAWRGNAAAAAEQLDLARRLSPPGRRDLRAWQYWTTGLLALGEGRHWEAYVDLGAAVAAHRDPGLLAIADLVEAACRAGCADQVRQRLDRAEAAAMALGTPLPLLLVHRSRALLGDEPDERFPLALAVDGYPLQAARTRLVYGEWLRRQRRIAAARDELAAALTGFEEVGAEPWAARARAELRAAGIATTGGERVRAAAGQLTAQELQIAQLAAKGMTNKEIGGQLFLSHRTVGSHLYRIFPKLGISGRAALRDALGEAG